MSIELDKLPDDTAVLKNIIKEQLFKYQVMEEKYLTLRNKFFARSSEKLSKEDQNQLRLFNEAELGYIEEESIEDRKNDEDSDIKVKSYTRKKKGRKPIPADIPREEVIHDLPDEEKKCSCCGKERPQIGSEDSEELDIIPAEIKVIKHKRLKYGACKCEESQKQEEKQVITAKAPKRLLPGSIASYGLLAFIFAGKFCDHLPFYRQEKQFLRIGIDISRKNMCNWAIKASRKCQDLLNLLLEEIRGGPLIQMDETTLQVIDEPGKSVSSKSYMWVTVGYTKDLNPIVVYHYHPTRSGDIPYELLKDYSGYLQTDGYSGYNKIGIKPGVIHVGCWAHARRYFYEAEKISKNSKSAKQGLSYITSLYRIEKELRTKNMSDEDFAIKRKEKANEIFEKFYTWLTKKVNQIPPETKLGKAVNYTLSEWEKLTRYTGFWFLTPDNNYCENKIRPFVLGRKNWLFSNTPLGAHASAAIYSLIETAKANDLEPYRYLRYIFKKLPEVKSSDELRYLLPMNVSVDQLFSA
jgi:transposase